MTSKKVTSWKEICTKLKMSGLTGNSRFGGGSDDSATSGTLSTSSTPQNNNRGADNEWQMNYVINKKDGL